MCAKWDSTQPARSSRASKSFLSNTLPISPLDRILCELYLAPGWSKFHCTKTLERSVPKKSRPLSASNCDPVEERDCNRRQQNDALAEVHAAKQDQADQHARDREC